MKNLLLISILFFIFSCGNDTQKEATAHQVNTTAPTEIKKNTPSATVVQDSETPIASTAPEEKPTPTASKETETMAKMEVKKETKMVASNEKKAVATTTSKQKEAGTKASTATSVDKKMMEEKAKEAEAMKILAEKTAKDAAEKKAKAAKDKAAAAAATLAENGGKTSGSGSAGHAAKPEKPAFSHAAFDALLRKYVSTSGKVNYQGLKKEEAKLNEYLLMLSGTPIGKDWSRSKKMAYWINAYNAHTIKLILKNYPVASITKLHGGKPWDVKWIKLNGKTLSLNSIENDILRPQYKDARIHFAVNCAAQSCPPLLNRAWTAKNLNTNLDKQAKAFINNPKFNKISPNSAEVSKIFDWYGKDFGNLIDFLNKYSTTKINSGATISYKEYDWKLNGK